MTASAVADRRRRFRLQLLLGFLVLLTIGYTRQLLASPSVGQDFRTYYAGAVVLRAGGNPYDWSVLGATENALYNVPDRLPVGDPRYFDFQPLPEGPWLCLAIEPLTLWPWRQADAIWTVLLLVLLAISTGLLLYQCGWRRTPLRLGWLAVALSPVVFINLFLGAATPVVVAAFAGALALVERDRAWAAGLLLAAVWIKPNIGLTLPLVVVLFHPDSWRRLLVGFAAGTLAAFAIAGALLGAGLWEWPKGIIQLWQSVQGTQPDIASLHSFYYPLLSGWPKMAALVLASAAMGAYAVVALRRSKTPALRAVTFLVIWLCALPYVHSFDTILLLPAFAMLVGPTLRGFEDRWVELAVWGFAVMPLLFFTGAHIGPFNGFSAIPVAATAWAWHRRMVAPTPATLRVAA